MLLIAQNHFQLIVEVGLILLATMIFVLNLVPFSLSVVTFLSLFLSGGFAILFGVDLAFLILSFGQHEFTHPFGPIALLAIMTALASLKVMEDFLQQLLSLEEQCIDLSYYYGLSVYS